MKRLASLSLAVLALTSIAATSASAQADYKFGKVTRAELERTDYPAIADGADAVVIDGLTDVVVVQWNRDQAITYEVNTEISRKIKILTEEGAEKQARVTIDLGSADGYTEDCAKASIKAVSYTLVDGDIVETEINKSDIKYVRHPDDTACLEFLVPNTVAGSVIEYTYVKRASIKNGGSKRITDSGFMIFPMQHDIPALRSRCSVAVGTIPAGCGSFASFKEGAHPVKSKRAKITKSVSGTNWKIDRPYRVGWRGYYGDYSYLSSSNYGEYETTVYTADDLPAKQGGDAACIRLAWSKSPDSRQTCN